MSRPPPLRVYLSSTMVDLLPERQAVKDVLGGECVVVDSYVADERSVRDSCVADVAGCDLYIAIVGLRYGAIPAGHTASITQQEYQAARDHQIPAFVFVKDEDEIKPRFHDAVSRENPRERIEQFRQALTTAADDGTRGMPFKTAADLKEQVLKAYLRFQQRQSRTGSAPPLQRIEGRPYPGLRAFHPDEADRFFGRDAEVQALLQRLLAREPHFLALIGASGSGKSSLVYAGLMSRLAQPGARGAWVAAAFAPRALGDDPFLPLAQALKDRFPAAGWHAARLAQRLRERPADIAGVAAQGLVGCAAGTRLLLFVDQFEELFAQKVDAGERSAFFALLAAAAAHPQVQVVVAMRADFYAQWPQDEASIALLNEGHFPVALPGPGALERMIVQPAEAAGLRFDPPTLVQRILQDTGTAPGALALAEYALAQLYEQREGPALTEAAYQRLGGVAGAINGLAEQAVALAQTEDGAGLDDEAFTRLFTAIASVEEQGPEQALAVVRRRATAADLPGAAMALAQRLVDQRLLVGSAGQAGQPGLYEVGHEAVFSHWQRFKDWYAVYADHLATRRQVERAAAEWQQAGRTPVLRWGWERQKPALQALHALSHLPAPPPDPRFTDAGLALWRSLQDVLPYGALRDFLQPEPLALLDELQHDETPHRRREDIGLRLNQLGDKRRGVGLSEDGLPDIDWVDVPAGEVMLEGESGAEERGPFSVQPFQMARYPVTWCQYQAFLHAADGYSDPKWFNGRPKKDVPGNLLWSFGNYPAVNVSWYDAMAYCHWLGARLGCRVLLPTECEWQWAAVADTGHAYPWGDLNAARANSAEAGIGRTVAVGLYPRGRGLFNLDDMAGNVWQWCLNDMQNPEQLSDDFEASRVLRGGSWGSVAGYLRASNRLVYHPNGRSGNFGFRVCRHLLHRKAGRRRADR